MNHIDADSSEDLQEMRIILLGRTGGGKSALGNSICGSKEKNFPFKSSISSSSITQTPQTAYREYVDRKLCVIDTPGLFDTNRSNDETIKQLTIAFQSATPGPHAFLIVLSGRCTDEELTVLDLLKKKFGEYFLDHCFIAVTHEDIIRDNDIQSSDDEIIQKYFQEAPQILQEFRINCNNRCFLIDNRASFEERERKITRLIEMIKYNEDHHPNPFFNQEMFDQAERYDREWNNDQFDCQQKEIKKEVGMKNRIQHLCEPEWSQFWERQQLIQTHFDEEQARNTNEEELGVKIAAKTMNIILPPKTSTSTDKNQSAKMAIQPIHKKTKL